jgi:hypothetical protein
MSTSINSTRERIAAARARFSAMVVFPSPELPEATIIVCSV